MYAERQLVRIMTVIPIGSVSRSICRIGSYCPSYTGKQPNRSMRLPYVVQMSSDSSNNVRQGVLLLCWHCGEALSTKSDIDNGAVLLCSRCGRLQPLPAGTDFFSYFGLDDPAGAAIDEKELKRRFRRMQSLVHPDKFVVRGEHERALSDQHSAFLNDAYRTLRDPFARAEYLLSLLETLKNDSVAASSSSAAVANASTDSAFADDEGTVEDSAMAAEMMELMEDIEQMEQDSTQIGQRLVRLDLEIYGLLRRATDQMVARNLSEARQTLRRISYLRRSRRLLEAKRNGERWSGEHNK